MLDFFKSSYVFSIQANNDRAQIWMGNFSIAGWTKQIPTGSISILNLRAQQKLGITGWATDDF
jgi:hypothetical protein